MNKVLVIIPIYNVEDYLKGAIESVLQQTHTDFELVLIDDCSTDNSYKIAKSYEHLDNVTVLKNDKNRGCYYTRNRGLKLFKDREWDYFTVHDGDDISDINRFEKILKFFNNNPKIIGAKTTAARVHYSTGEVDIENGKPRIQPCDGIAFYSRKAFESIGYFDNTRFSGDTDYLWRLQAWINTNKKDYVMQDHTECLYIAYIRDGNLTVEFPVSGQSRQEYFQKIINEINNVMIPGSNFYREIFD